MFKKILAGAGIGAVLALAAVATPAFATHPAVSGTAVCDPTTGNNNITWTVSGDAGYPNVTWEFKTASRVADQIVGKTGKGGATVTATESVAPNVKSLTLDVGIQFSNHNKADIVHNTGTVRLVSCERTKPDQPAPYTQTGDEPGVPDCTTFTVTTRHWEIQHSWVFDVNAWAWVDTPGEKAYLADTARTVTAEECPAPPAKVTYGDWKRSDVPCGAVTAAETRSVTTTPWVFTPTGWVPGEPVVTSEERTVDVVPVECPVVTPPPTPTNPPVLVDAKTPPTALATTGVNDSTGWWALGAALVIALGIGGLVYRKVRTN